MGWASAGVLYGLVPSGPDRRRRRAALASAITRPGCRLVGAQAPYLIESGAAKSSGQSRRVTISQYAVIAPRGP